MISNVHLKSKEMAEQLEKWGAPTDVSHSVHRGARSWPRSWATFLSVGLQTKNLRSRARSLLLHCQMRPVEVAIIEVAWLLPVDVNGYRVKADRPQVTPFPFPRRPTNHDLLGLATPANFAGAKGSIGAEAARAASDLARVAAMLEPKETEQDDRPTEIHVYTGMRPPREVAHQDGEHAESPDPKCPMCSDQTGGEP
jgi:hypothetical protein